MDLAELRTRTGVANLMATYQFLADSGKIRQLAGLFGADAVLESDLGRYTGPEGILGFFRDTKHNFIAANIGPSRHHLSSIHVDPRPDGGASTYACFQYIGSRGLDHWGTYRDEIVEAAGGWRFQHRRVDVEGYVPGSAIENALLTARAAKVS